jgi:hypothetical protein
LTRIPETTKVLANLEDTNLICGIAQAAQLFSLNTPDGYRERLGAAIWAEILRLIGRGYPLDDPE